MDSVSGPSFGRVRERPFDHKAEISPRQHPPESTILLKSIAKKIKILTCVSLRQTLNINSSIFLQGV